jgi:1-acyl-sn-glycerol-3-phosphate acyltransferase
MDRELQPLPANARAPEGDDRARRASAAGDDPTAPGHRETPVHRDSWWRKAAYGAVRVGLAILWTVTLRARALGAGNVPRSGPVLIAANHQSYLDPPVLGALVPRRIDYIARAGLFQFKPLGAVISLLNAIPIRENEGDAAAIKHVVQRLREGRAVLIFPEGTRSPDGAMRPFKRGVALLVKKASCPVVPAAIEGAFDAWPRGKRPSLWGGRVMVAYGKPIDSATLMRDGPDAALRLLEREIDALRRDLRQRLRESSGGTYPPAGPGDLPLDP